MHRRYSHFSSWIGSGDERVGLILSPLDAKNGFTYIFEIKNPDKYFHEKAENGLESFVEQAMLSIKD